MESEILKIKLQAWFPMPVKNLPWWKILSYKIEPPIKLESRTWTKRNDDQNNPIRTMKLGDNLSMLGSKKYRV